MRNITLFNLWHNGDVINSTSFARIIKEKDPDTFIKFVVNQKHSIFLKTNPYIDKIEHADMQFCEKYRDQLRLTNSSDIEINTWPCVARTSEDVNNFFNWDVLWEMALVFNKFLGKDFINKQDCLLPELFYTEEEKQKALLFTKENSPFIILEIESFSGQYRENISTALNAIKPFILNRPKLKVFISLMRMPVEKPFYSLNKYNLRVASLICQYAEVYFGISSGITAATFERTLIEPKLRVLSYPTSKGVNSYFRFKQYPNTRYVVPSAFISNVIEYLKG